MVDIVMENEKRYILDKNNGFNVMVNLYILRYMYSHMNKAECFEDATGMRKKSQDFHTTIINISRQRLSRILNGERFEISKEERANLCNMFGIEAKYFLRNGEIISIRTLEENDWKCFFNYTFYLDYEVGVPNKKRDELVEKVTSALKTLANEKVVLSEYESDTPVYRIYYYYKNGVTYKEESRLTRFLKALSQLRISDWDELEDLEQMKNYAEMLSKHTDYVNVVIDYHRLREEK